jgi:hypothetical protein
VRLEETRRGVRITMHNRCQVTGRRAVIAAGFESRALLSFRLHSRIRGVALDPRQRECPGFRPKNGQNRPLASGKHSAQPRRMPLQSMVQSGKLIIPARQARFCAQSPVPGRLPALAGVPFWLTGSDQTHLALPRRGPFCLQDADPRPSGQALPWSPLTHRMLTVSPPEAHRILALDNIVIYGVHREGIR